MSAQIKNGGVVDVLAYHDVLIASHRALSADAYYAQELPKVEAVRAAVAELIEQMRDVLELWDSNSMSIDGKAATMQCRPEKWRAALANVGGTK